MRIRLIAGTLLRAFFCLSLLAASIGCMTRLQTGVDHWSSLQNRTGWILLGHIDVRSGEWATNPSHRTSEEDEPGKPRIGDVIEVTRELQVVINEYQVTAERHRLNPPVGGVITNDDITDVRLLPDARVKVVDMYLEPVLNGTQGVWVRVVPK